MLRNVSYNNPQFTREINELVGTPFSIFQRIKMGGNGSPRLVISEASEEIDSLLEVDNRRRYANIELRPKGIIVGFRSRLEAYVFVIPYHKLVLYKSTEDTYSIYTDTTVIKVHEDASDRPIHKFMRKIIEGKNSLNSIRIENL